jgi:hypothetical protein
MHTINLIVKSILQPFDAQKTNDVQAFNNALANLAKEDDLDIFTDHMIDAMGVNREVNKEVKEAAHEEDHNINASLRPITQHC